MTISVKAPLAVFAVAVGFAAVGAGSALAADPPKSAKMSDKAMKAMEAKAMKAKEAKAMKAKEMADKAMKAKEAEGK